jgi:ribulose-phosphate 3-epimerase
MIELAPSILAADFNILGEQIRLLEDSGVKYLHIDVMDGNYVPSISFGMPVIASIRKNSKLIFDVHLMIEEPIQYLEDFKEAGADIITVHPETCKHLQRTIVRIKELGLKVGVAINPATSLKELEYILGDIDMVLIMTVNPGFGGQALIPNTIQKIRDLKKMIVKAEVSIDIEVDGGISVANVKELLTAGANIVVSGTSVFKGNIKENVTEFQKRFAEFSNIN